MKQIRLCGLGGQGIVAAGKILAQAAIGDKKIVSLTSGYGSAVRGGISRSDLIISDRFNDFPMITEIDILVSMVQEAYEKSYPMVKEDGMIFLDNSLIKARDTSSIKHFGIPAIEIAIKELNSEMAGNILLLGFANSVGQIVSETSLEESIKNTVSSRFVEVNLRALQLGLDLARKAAA